MILSGAELGAIDKIYALQDIPNVNFIVISKQIFLKSQQYNRAKTIYYTDFVLKIIH